MGSSSKEQQLPSSPSTTSAGAGAGATEKTATLAVDGDTEEISPLQQKEPDTRIPEEEEGNGTLALVKTSDKRPPPDQPAEPPLRVLLSDPLTGDLMEDATLLPCGHSFGSGGVQRVLQSNACVTCGLHVSQESLTPNLALRAVVKAFRREGRNRRALSRKRQRDRFIQDQIARSSDNTSSAVPRLRGPQFPFSVGDKVMIKGNKRTPDRFVNREATITAQCLNGWFMVKTLDNGEAVKLQHRSLVKVTG